MHISTNGLVNSKAVICVCSEVWGPQGQNSCGVCCTCKCRCLSEHVRVCSCVPRVYLHTDVRVFMCNWGELNSEVSKEDVECFFRVISGIYHCGNQHHRRPERLISGIRNQTAHCDGAKPYWFPTEGESRKFIILTPSWALQYLLSPQCCNEIVSLPNTITNPPWQHWSMCSSVYE